MPVIAAQITNHRPSPRILGIVTAEMLLARRYPEPLWACGGVELRVDGTPPEEIAGVLKDFTREKKLRSFDGPVVFTARLRRDGGFWENAAAAEREALWAALPPGSCDFVDLEIEEIHRIQPATRESLRRAGIGVLLSHHAFTPPPAAHAAFDAYRAWEGLLDSMRRYHPAGVKFAVALDEGPRGRSQAEALLRLARRVAGEYSISCVLGMGRQGSLTRLVAPLMGCPLTYGFMGAAPLAPGQMPAEAMHRFFQRSAAEGLPSDRATESEWLDWAAELWSRVGNA
jgi:3-dehydroquinate dehydratase-1